MIAAIAILLLAIVGGAITGVIYLIKLLAR